MQSVLPGRVDEASTALKLTWALVSGSATATGTKGNSVEPFGHDEDRKWHVQRQADLT